MGMRTKGRSRYRDVFGEQRGTRPIREALPLRRQDTLRCFAFSFSGRRNRHMNTGYYQYSVIYGALRFWGGIFHFHESTVYIVGEGLISQRCRQTCEDSNYQRFPGVCASTWSPAPSKASFLWKDPAQGGFNGLHYPLQNPWRKGFRPTHGSARESFAAKSPPGAERWPKVRLKGRGAGRRAPKTEHLCHLIT